MVFLVRHGESSSNQNKIIDSYSDATLTFNGKCQADSLGKYFSSKVIEKIITSPQIRAVETSNIINHYLNCQILIDNNLRERDYGVLNGYSRENLVTWRRERNVGVVDPTQDWNNIHEVESDNEVFKRVYDLIDGQLDLTTNTIIVTHSGVFKAYVYNILKIPMDRLLAFKFRNACLLSLKKVDNFVEIQSLVPIEELNL